MASRTAELPFSAGHTPHAFAQFGLGFLLLLGLKLLLLDACEVDPSRHAIRRARWSTQLYNLAMPVQAFGLALMSSGLALLLGSTGETAHAQWGTELLCDGLAFILGAFKVVSLLHLPPQRRDCSAPGVDPRVQHYQYLLVRVWWLQQGLNGLVLSFCVLAPRLPKGSGSFCGHPLQLLLMLNALIYVLGRALG